MYITNSDAEGFVYFVLDKPYFARGEWRIKIGWTINLNERLKEAYGKNGILLGVFHGVFTDEAATHELFGHKRTRGYSRGGRNPEWFRIDDELIDFIQNATQFPAKCSLPMMEAHHAKSLETSTIEEREAAYRYGVIQHKIATLREQIAMLEAEASECLATHPTQTDKSA